MGTDTMLALAGTVVVLAIAAVSAASYDHREATYREGRERSASIEHFRVVYRLLQASTIGVAIGALWSGAPWLLEVHDDPSLRVAGLVAAALSSWLFVASKRALGENYSPCFDAHAPFTIVSRGPYRVIRHPIYTANVALLASLFVASGSLWLLVNACVLTVYYATSALAEERELLRSHEGYRSYRDRTGMFLPRLTGR